MDIKDFFPSIKELQILKIFRDMGYSASAAARLADICCYEGELPQGAPTSPYLANLRCRELDSRLEEIALQYGLTYTRYADDMTFSGDFDAAELLRKTESFLRIYGLELNHEKTRLCTRGSRQIVTGIVDLLTQFSPVFLWKLQRLVYHNSCDNVSGTPGTQPGLFMI